MFEVLFVIGFLFILISLTNFHKENKQRLENNFDKYKVDHPDCISGGKVKCYTCGSQRVHARGLMNRTFTREHFCTQCGTTLYYSPEGKT